MLSPRLQLKVAQKQILTPGLVQMVTVLQLNRLELKEMINQEMVNNPVLEESADAAEEISPEELQPLLEAERKDLQQKLAAREAEFGRKADDLRRQQEELAEAMHLAKGVAGHRPDELVSW